MLASSSKTPATAEKTKVGLSPSRTICYINLFSIMAHVTPRDELAASHLSVQVDVEFFAAMKEMTFNQLVQDDPPQRRNLVGILAHHALPTLGLKSRWTVGACVGIEPSHPQWFVEGMFRDYISKHKRSLLKLS